MEYTVRKDTLGLEFQNAKRQPIYIRICSSQSYIMVCDLFRIRIHIHIYWVSKLKPPALCVLPIESNGGPFDHWLYVWFDDFEWAGYECVLVFGPLLVLLLFHATTSAAGTSPHRHYRRAHTHTISLKWKNPIASNLLRNIIWRTCPPRLFTLHIISL